jgi:hypothetical protein
MNAVLKFCEQHLLWPMRRWLECHTKRCDYYQSYQALGPAELTHVGYHAAERLALDHRVGCEVREERECETCRMWAERLRGEVWAALMGNRSVVGDQMVKEKKKTYGFITR